MKRKKGKYRIGRKRCAEENFPACRSEAWRLGVFGGINREPITYPLTVLERWQAYKDQPDSDHPKPAERGLGLGVRWPSSIYTPDWDAFRAERYRR